MEEYIKIYRFALVDGSPVREESWLIPAGYGDNSVDDNRNFSASDFGVDDVDPDTLLFKHVVINNLADESQIDGIAWFGAQDSLKLREGVELITEEGYLALVAQAEDAARVKRKEAINRLSGGNS